MSNEWSNHTIEYANANGITFKEGLSNNSNRIEYYNKKTDTVQNNEIKKNLSKEICYELHCFNEVNKQNSNSTVDYITNDKQIKQKIKNIKNVLEPKVPKEVKAKVPKEVKAKVPKEVKAKVPKEVKAKVPKEVKAKK